MTDEPRNISPIRRLARALGGTLEEGFFVFTDEEVEYRLEARTEDGVPKIIGRYRGFHLRIQMIDRLEGRLTKWIDESVERSRWHMEVRLGYWGPRGLRIVHRDRATDGVEVDVGHPIVQRMVCIYGLDGAVLAPLFDDETFVSALMSVLHQYPGSTLNEQWFSLQYGGEKFPDFLERVKSMVYAATCLEALARRLSQSNA